MRKQALHPRTAALNKTQKNQSKKSRTDALAWLSTTFPQAFDNKVCIRPLKLGIMSDILLHADKAKDAGISKSKLREAVVVFTRRLDYLACLKAREMRIDLDGQPTDLVSEEDAERASIKIKKRIEKQLKNARKLAPAIPQKSQKPGQRYIQSATQSQPAHMISSAAFHEHQGAVGSTPRVASVRVKQKPRSFDPAAVARLKEKLGLSREQADESHV